MRIGVDVGGTNTDAVLMDGTTVISSTKTPTTANVSEGIAKALRTVIADSGHRHGCHRRCDDRHHALHQRRS